MKRAHTHLFILILSILFSQEAVSQVTIGSGLGPLKGALLDLKEQDSEGGVTANKGLGLPRVNLEEIDQLFPMFGKVGDIDAEYESDKPGLDQMHLGLVVYNLTLNLEKGLCPGVYAWSEMGSSYSWVRLPDPCEAPLKLENSPNSFIVKSGEAVEIPLGKPYIVAESRNDLPNISIDSKAYVELLWQDAQSLISKVELVGENKGPYSTMKVETSSSTSGNALVAVRMGPTGSQSDPIVWSWHIWVTDYDPNNGGTTYAHNNGEKDYVFMDRNLGATTTTKTDPGVIGLTYQWGRKDPFSSSGNFSPETEWRDLYDINGAVLTETDEIHEAPGTGITHELASDGLAGMVNNLLRSVENPTVFFYGVYNGDGTENNRPVYKAIDWYTLADDLSAGENDLWGASGRKSDFDPCPEGWRVPMFSNTKSPWAYFEDNDDEIIWGSTSYVQDDPSGKGADFIANGSVFTKLGYHPYSNFRRAREYYIGGSVGSKLSYGAGGSFLGGNFIDVDQRESLIWSANGNTGGVEAKALSLRMNYSGLQEVPSLKIENYSKAAGAYVRCVADSNSNATY